MNFFAVLILVFAQYFTASAAVIGCRDEKNKIVDYFYMYNLPQDLPAQTVYKSDGLRYAYKTSTDPDSKWIDSNIKINDSDSMTGLTLNQMYNTNTIAILYNDQTPSLNDDDSKGHSKGVLVTNGEQGFWLIHSIPKFPPSLEDGSYDYPTTGSKYGQNLLCITMKPAEIDKASTQLMMNNVQVYSSRLPENLKAKFPNIVRLLEGNQILTLKSIKGVEFTSFAKSSAFQKDLYQDLVGPSLSTDLSVETWRMGTATNNLPSNCSTTYNVNTINYIEITESNYKFASSRDHSKWAVASDVKSNWICVGDINRQYSQFKRGGGTVCQNSKPIADAYRSIITGLDPCGA